MVGPVPRGGRRDRRGRAAGAGAGWGATRLERGRRRAYADRRWQPGARPHPLSRSTGRTGEPMTRRHTPVSSAPARARSASPRSPAATLREFEGDAALDATCRPASSDRDTTVWVDMIDPSPAQVEAIGTALGLHPLIVEDVLEGNQRAKIEIDRRGRPPRAVRPDPRQALRGQRDRPRAGAGLPAHGPRRELGPTRDPPPADQPHGRHGARPGPPAVGHLRRASWTATSRSPTSSATPSMRSRTGSSPRPRPRSLDDLFALKRELIEVRRAASPTREVFNQLTNRDLPLIDRRGARLLPRHLRPRHPPDRRARQLPRARVLDAGRLPHPDQQQPVGDHEAADRGDGDPGRHRRHRRASSG